MEARRLGKFSFSSLHKLIYPRLGAQRRGILVGPEFGVDVSVQKLGNGKVLVATCDPLSYVPELGAESSAWISVNLLASDLTTSGISPQYGIFDLNLPPMMDDKEFEIYWRSFHSECRNLGISIVGGHTGRYEGCDYTVIGGGVMYSVGDEGRYITSSMATDGDAIILTKGAAVETTAILARVFPNKVKKALGPALFKKAWQSLSRVSTVKDALTAASVGMHRSGVTAMHDATEGGVVSAVWELAYASHLGAELTLSNIKIAQETIKICKLFKIDPLRSLSEGSLVIACNPQCTSKLIKRLRAARIESQIIGALTSKRRGVYAISANRRLLPLRYTEVDPYWNAYWTAHRNRWN